MNFGRQTTVRERVVIKGRGVHSNAPVTLAINPADANTGIVFHRALADGKERVIEADWRNVSMTELCTVIGDQATHTIHFDDFDITVNADGGSWSRGCGRR